MTDELLLRRIEEQAVEIAAYKAELETAKAVIEEFPRRLTGVREAMLRQLSRCSVNCGHYSSCSLVRRALDDMERSTNENREG
jgi:hypothetical protein